MRTFGCKYHIMYFYYNTSIAWYSPCHCFIFTHYLHIFSGHKYIYRYHRQIELKNMLWTRMPNQWYIEGRTGSTYGSLGNTTFYFTVIWFKPAIWHIHRSPREIIFKPLQCYALEKSRKTNTNQLVFQLQETNTTFPKHHVRYNQMVSRQTQEYFFKFVIQY